MTYKIIMRQLGGADELEAASLESCPSLVRAFILNNDISSADWLAGEVYADGELIESLAFNGAKME